MANIDQIERVHQALSNAISGCFFEHDQPRAVSDGPDFVMVCPPSRFAVRLGSVTAPRIADVLGRVAAGALELRSWRGPDGELPLVIVLAPAWGPKMIEAVRDFVSRHASDVSWGLVSPHGSCHLELRQTPETPVIADHVAEAPTPRARRGGRPGALFTDLNRWMLKLLLMRHAPEDRWSGFRGKIDSPTELSRIAGVSVETAHRFARSFSASGYLRADSGDLVIVRARDLLAAWLVEERQSPSVWTYVRSIDGGPVDLARVLSPQPGRMVALGGLEACRRHGVLHTTSGSPLLLTQGPLSTLVVERDLEYCAQHESQVVISEPRFTASVFGGVGTLEGLPVVDLMQAALDVAPMGGRGIEQAELIVDQILSWSAR